MLCLSQICTVGSKDNLHPYISFHATLRSAHQSFISRLEEQARIMLRTHLEAATSQFAMNMYAHVPDPGDPLDVEGEEDGDMDGAAEDAEVRRTPRCVCHTLATVRLSPCAHTEAQLRVACICLMWSPRRRTRAGRHANAWPGASADDGA